MDDPSIEATVDERQATAQHLARRLHALLLGGIDMQDVLETAEYLLENLHAPAQGAEMDWRVRRTLETGMFITYARPFIRTRKLGLPRLRQARDLSEELVESHNEILSRRNMVYAHADETDMRTILQSTTPMELREWLSGSGQLSEQWFSSKPEMLNDVTELARANLAAFLAEIEAIVSRHS